MRYHLVLFCMACWGLAVFLPKLARASLSPAGVVAANTAGYLLLLPLVLWRLLPSDRAVGEGWLWGIAVGILFVLGNYCFYELLGSGQVARLVPLTALYQVIPVLLGVVLLRERLAPAQWCGVLLAMVACYLLAQPSRASAG